MEAEIVRRDDPGALTTESTETLKGRLARLLQRTAEDVRDMAAIVGELERRGEDLSALRLGLIDHLRRVAAGQLLPEVVVQFAGEPALLERVAALPLPDQQRMTSGEPVPVAVWRDGRVDWRQVAPIALSRRQLGQVFARGRLRTESEQVTYLEDRAARPARKPGRAKLGKVRADTQRGGIVVGRTFAPVAEILRALADLAAADYDDEVEGESAKLMIELSQAEHRQLKVRAARGGVSMGQLARRALAAHGLLAARDLREVAREFLDDHGETLRDLAD